MVYKKYITRSSLQMSPAWSISMNMLKSSSNPIASGALGGIGFLISLLDSLQLPVAYRELGTIYLRVYKIHSLSRVMM